MEYPRVCQEEGSLRIEFAPESSGAKRKVLRMVLDFGSSGEILGVEIISLLFNAGKSALEVISQVVPTTGDGLRYGYDEECDCFSLSLKAGYSPNQESVDGSATCDAEGRIIGLSAEWKKSK